MNKIVVILIVIFCSIITNKQIETMKFYKNNIDEIVILSILIFLYNFINLKKSGKKIKEIVNKNRLFYIIGITFFLYGKWYNLEILSIKKTYLLYLITIISFYFRMVIYSEEENINKEGKNIYKSREKNIVELDEIFNQGIAKSILVTGKWGSGKTFFIKYFFKKDNNFNKYKTLWIKTSLFKNKEEIRIFLFRELSLILEKEGIYSYELQEILKKFDFTIGGFKFNNPASLEYNFEEIKNTINSLKRKKEIVIILDDLERVPNVNFRKDIISFISEIEDFIGIKTVILLDEEKIEIETDFLEKYRDSKISLLKIPTEEIIEEEFKEQKIQKEVIINFFQKIENEKSNIKCIFSIVTEALGINHKSEDEKTKGIKLKEEITERLKVKLEVIILKFKNPRFIKNLGIHFKKLVIEKAINDEQQEKEKKIIIETVCIYYILKDVFPDFIENIRIDTDEYYGFDSVEEKDDIKRIINFFINIAEKNPENDTIKMLDSMISGREYTFLKKSEKLELENYLIKIKTKDSIFNSRECNEFIGLLVRRGELFREENFEEIIKEFYNLIEKSYMKKQIDVICLLDLIYYWFENPRLALISYKKIDFYREEIIKKIQQPYYFESKNYYMLEDDILKNMFQRFLPYFNYVINNQKYNNYIYPQGAYTSVKMMEISKSIEYLKDNGIEEITKEVSNIEKFIEMFDEFLDKKRSENEVEWKENKEYFEKIKKHLRFIEKISNEYSALDSRNGKNSGDIYPKNILEARHIQVLKSGIREGIYKKSDIDENLEELKIKYTNPYDIKEILRLCKDVETLA